MESEIRVLLADDHVVLREATAELIDHQIARCLDPSVRTIEAHLTHIYAKLGVGSRIEAVLLAQRKGWLAAE